MKNKELFCDKYFGLTYKETLQNLEVFYHGYTNNILGKSQEYKLLAEIYSLLTSDDEIFDSYNTTKFENKNLQENLYDAFKEMQIKTFELIKGQIYDLDNSDVNEELSSKMGVTVYDISNRRENVLLNTTTWSKEHNKNYVIYPKGSRKKPSTNDFPFEAHFQTQVGSHIMPAYKSVSLVDSKKIKTYRDPNEYVTLIYGPDIPNDYLITITNSDAYVEREARGSHYVTYQSKAFYDKPNKIIDRTKEYNEIAILKKDFFNEDSKEIRPIGIFCVNKITSTDIEISKKYNLPIIFTLNRVMEQTNDGLAKVSIQSGTNAVPVHDLSLKK